MKRLLIWLHILPCPAHNFVPVKNGASERDGITYQLGRCTRCRDTRRFSVAPQNIEQIKQFWKQKEKELNDSDRTGTHQP